MTDLEKWIREATTEAAQSMKCHEPDDVDYFDMFRKYDEAKEDDDDRQSEQEQEVHTSPHENGITPKERLVRIAFPQRTTYGAKIDVGYRDLQAGKRWVREWCETNKKNEVWKTWVKCHDFWELRHSILVDKKLEGEASNALKYLDEEQLHNYEKLNGFQKTNFLVTHLVTVLIHNEEETKAEQTQRFLAFRQRENQTADEYITFLDMQRARLPGLTGGITDEDMKVKLIALGFCWAFPRRKGVIAGETKS